jgi:hypothetical protein
MNCEALEYAISLGVKLEKHAQSRYAYWLAQLESGVCDPAHGAKMAAHYREDLAETREALAQDRAELARRRG